MNGLYALTIIMIVYAVGDIIATKTKAIISMLFVASVVFAVGFWNGLPATIFDDASLKLFASVTVGLLLVHMGTTIKAGLLKDGRPSSCPVSSVAICLGVYFIGGLIIDQSMALIGAHSRRRRGAFLVMSEALKSWRKHHRLWFSGPSHPRRCRFPNCLHSLQERSFTS